MVEFNQAEPLAAARAREQAFLLQVLPLFYSEPNINSDVVVVGSEPEQK